MRIGKDSFFATYIKIKECETAFASICTLSKDCRSEILTIFAVQTDKEMENYTVPEHIADCNISAPQSALLQTKKRIEYIDALRGFTMFLVVVGHVMNYSLCCHESFLFIFLYSFRMPLFFFVSGFVGYRMTEKFGMHDFAANTWKKVQLAIIPCIIFFTLYSHFILNAGWGIFGPAFIYDGFREYWFTPVLFEMFVVYYLLLLSGSICGKIRYIPALFFILSLATMALGRIINIPEVWWKGIPNLENLSSYMVFFASGIIVRSNFQRFVKILNCDWFNGVVFLIWIASTFLHYIDVPVYYGTFVWSRFSGLFVIFAFFYHCRNYFAAGGTLSRIFQFVGRRTLDIYLLHFFLLPEMPQSIINYFTTTNSAIIVLTASIAVSIAIVAVVILFSTLIRKNSNLLAHYLLGARREKQKVTETVVD